MGVINLFAFALNKQDEIYPLIVCGTVSHWSDGPNLSVLHVPAGVWPESRRPPEVCEGLAGQMPLQTHSRLRDPAAELRASLEGQERPEEAKIGGPLRGAFQEAQRGYGEQDLAAAAQDKWAGDFAAHILASWRQIRDCFLT